MARVVLFIVAGALAVACAQSGSANLTKPHIMFIVADDLGWNDVGWHNPDVKTPVLDQLAHEGVILNQSYVNYVCTPSRTAFMTGYFPYHVGSQHAVFVAKHPQYIPSNFTFLPEKLKELGYATHMVGKWHLGFCNWKYTPTYRGFDSFYGYYNGAEDYYTHDVDGGLDLRDNKDTVTTMSGDYGTYFFADRMVDIIEKHPKTTPLFLYLPFQNVHRPLEVPKRFEDMYSNVHDDNRRKLLGMVSALDEAIGNVTMAMKSAGLWDNTLVIFTTDNGGWLIAGGNNYPLRGGKTTLWEGGTRGVAFAHGKMLQKTGYTNNELIHAVDWFPTILAAAGGTADAAMDGVSQLGTILSGQPSPRTEFVYNIDTVFPTIQGAIRVGDYKLIEGYAGKPDGWIRPANLTDQQGDLDPIIGTWLFNLKDDPTEHNNLADSMPDKLKEMQAKLAEYRKSIVPAIWPKDDPKSDPKNWGGAWSPGWC